MIGWNPCVSSTHLKIERKPYSFFNTTYIILLLLFQFLHLTFCSGQKSYFSYFTPLDGQVISNLAITENRGSKEFITVSGLEGLNTYNLFQKLDFEGNLIAEEIIQVDTVTGNYDLFRNISMASNYDSEVQIYGSSLKSGKPYFFSSQYSEGFDLLETSTLAIRMSNPQPALTKRIFDHIYFICQNNISSLSTDTFMIVKCDTLGTIISSAYLPNPLPLMSGTSFIRDLIPNVPDSTIEFIYAEKVLKLDKDLSKIDINENLNFISGNGSFGDKGSEYLSCYAYSPVIGTNFTLERINKFNGAVENKLIFGQIPLMGTAGLTFYNNFQFDKDSSLYISGFVPINENESVLYVTKFDRDFNQLFELKLKRPMFNFSSSTNLICSDGGLCILGDCISNQLNKRDAFVIKIGPNGEHDASLGIHRSNQEIPINFFPNPAAEHFIIDDKYFGIWDNGVIYNSIGQKVMAFKNTGDNSQVEIEDIPEGVYFVVLNKSGKRLFTQKLIKK